MNKICTKCGEEKSLDKFPKVKVRGNIYYRNSCQDCHNKSKMEYYFDNKETINEKNKKDYYLYPEKHKQQYLNYKQKYPWKIVWKSINERCYNPKTESYKWYGGRGIQNLLTIEDVKFLWFRDKAYLMNKPTIDKINNDGNYTLENCRFIEKSENSAKDKRKPVLQYDLQGNFIREFISVMDANRYFGKPGSHINDVANNKRSQAFGYLWRYK
jgi:hypothetical protein